MATTPPKPWNINEVNILVNNIPIDGAGANGTANLEKVADAKWTATVGQRGETVFNFMPSKLHRLTLTFLKTSRDNNTINAVNAIQEILSGQPLFPVAILDRNTGSIYEAEFCVLEDDPDIEFGPEVPDVEYRILMADMDREDVQLF